jgi:23S rRNA (uridine2552-2'-O)-methyltransferase
MKTQTKSKKVNKAWLQDHIQDPYVKRAKREGYRARAAYKLMEIDETLKLIKPGQTVVDLGSAPGAWSQYMRHCFAPKTAGVGGAAQGELNGRIVALDMLPMEPIEGVHFIQGDFREAEVVEQLQAYLQGQLVDVIASDMAPNLSGVEVADAARMADLIELAIEFAEQHLQPQGALICKIFHGSGYSQMAKLFKEKFQVTKPIKPAASRMRSSETFLVGLGLKKTS